jgi:hypothetical protein
MIKTSELTGAQLDYWVARAEGIPAEQLSVQRIQRSADAHCVREWRRRDPHVPLDMRVLAFSTDWAIGGPLIEKHGLALLRWKNDEGTPFWSTDSIGASHYLDVYLSDYEDTGSQTPLQAICRAVVRAAFGDDVEEVTVCE